MLFGEPRHGPSSDEPALPGGLVFKVQGKGSYVSRPTVLQSPTALQGLGEAM